MKIIPRRIIETALYVDNLDEAEEFYTKILGLEILSRKEGRHIFLHCGDAILLLFDPDETIKPEGNVPSHGTKGPGHVAFMIEKNEFQTWRDHFTKHSIEIETEVDWEQGGHSLYFRDPSGNSLEFITKETWNI